MYQSQLQNKLLAALCLILVALTGCRSYDPNRPSEEEVQRVKVEEAIASFKDRDPDIKRWFDNAYGYAVFPTVGKGAVAVGGAYGRGRLYEQGQYVGNTSMKQLTVGFQWGGQAYSEIIFFEDAEVLEDFKNGNFEFGAQVSAVAATLGASADAAYDKGVAVFTIAKGGLMYEASVGGQKFNYYPR